MNTGAAGQAKYVLGSTTYAVDAAAGNLIAAGDLIINIYGWSTSNNDWGSPKTGSVDLSEKIKLGIENAGSKKKLDDYK
jgi:hypothetical protein